MYVQWYNRKNYFVIYEFKSGFYCILNVGIRHTLLLVFYVNTVFHQTKWGKKSRVFMNNAEDANLFRDQ